ADVAAHGEGVAAGRDHHLVAVLPEHRLHLAAHLAVADHRHPHQRDSPKNSRCRLLTARSASASATTQAPFTSAAPNEIMTTFTSRRAWNMREIGRAHV